MTAEIGHNSESFDAENDPQLLLLIERLERLNEEKQSVLDDIKEVYQEVKAVGYDVKMTREMIKLREMSKDDRDERDHIRDTYRAALGML